MQYHCFGGFSQPFIETIKPSNQHSANPSRRVSREWGGSKHKSCSARPATGSTMVVLLNFFGLAHILTYLPYLRTLDANALLTLSSLNHCIIVWFVAQQCDPRECKPIFKIWVNMRNGNGLLMVPYAHPLHMKWFIYLIYAPH